MSFCRRLLVLAGTFEGYRNGTLCTGTSENDLYYRVFTEVTVALELLLFRVGMNAPAFASWFDCLWEIVCPWSSNRAPDTFGLSVNTTNVCSCV